MDAATVISRPVGLPGGRPVLARLLGLSFWSLARTEPFRFVEVTEAFDEYRGKSLAAVDRMWSRDKRALAGAGVHFDRWSAIEYRVDESTVGRRLQPGPVDTTALLAVASIPTLAIRADAIDLELGLRKLVPLGAPIATALQSRSSPVRVADPVGVLRSAFLLYSLVSDAGDRGLDLGTACSLVGVLEPRQLLEVATVLESLVVPDAVPPFDYLGFEATPDRLVLTMRARATPRLALAPREASAIRDAAERLGIEADLGYLDRVTWNPSAGTLAPTLQEIAALAA